MIIAYNLLAIRGQNQLQRNTKKYSDALAKLSSGLRINKAADDAAGLAISEKMRAQIRGLSQAGDNVQDGISLLQVAEGALASITDNLQRMRELAVQGANDTLTDADRNMIQEEARQLLNGVDETARDTEFNGMKLLDGTYENPALDNINSVEKIPLTQEWRTTLSGKIISATAATDGSVIVAGYDGSSVDSQNWLAKVDANGNVVWGKALPLDNTYNEIYNIQALADGGFIATSRRNRLVGSYNDNEPVIYKFNSNGEIEDSVVLSGSNENLFEIKQTSDGGFIATGENYNDLIVRKLDANLTIIDTALFTNPSGSHFKTGIDIVETADGGYIVVGEESYSSPSHKDGFVMKLDSSLTQVWEQKASNNVFSSIVECGNNSYMLLGENGLYSVDSAGNISLLNDSIGHNEDIWDYTHDWLTKTADNNYLVGADDGLYKVDSAGNVVWKLAISSNAVAQMDDRGYITADSSASIVKITPEALPVESESVDGLKLHVGANAGDVLTIYISEISTEAIEIDDMDLSSRSGSESGIGKIDAAIQKISAQRSSVGAYQNRLEYILSNISNAAENLIAAESRIRDTDMAKETMQLVKYSTLTQATQSMLAQASQQPQSVLNLLK